MTAAAKTQPKPQDPPPTDPQGPDQEPQPSTPLQAKAVHPEFQFAVPKTFKGRPGVDTLMDACERYGVNPDPDIKPIELNKWNYYPEDVVTGVPGYIQMVTGGGIKIRHYDDPDWPMDQDTEERLRNVFRSFAIDPDTKLPKPTPLPEDLTLPIEAVTGIPRKEDHRYRGGYLRSGGKTEAARRSAERRTRPKRA